MDAIINIGSFLDFVNSMSLSPRIKRWLGERLIHEAEKEEAKLDRKGTLCLLDSLAGSWADIDVDAMKLSVQEGRQSDDINKIMMFDEE